MNAHPDSAAFSNASSIPNIPISDRVILALDVPTVPDAEAIVREVGSQISFFKIGLQLQYNGGIEYAQRLVNSGKKVFLDSKIFDIGNTIERTVENIARMGVHFLTVHGDRKIIESAASVERGDLKIFAVTFLTNLDDADLRDMGIRMSMMEFVRHRAQIAIDAKADGVIASGKEAAMLKSISTLKVVTPGIRPVGTPLDDQRRVATPQEAIENGADYLVVGRPVLRATSKTAMIESIFSEVQAGLDARLRLQKIG